MLLTFLELRAKNTTKRKANKREMGAATLCICFLPAMRSPLTSTLPGITQIVIKEIHAGKSTVEKGAKYEMK